MANRASAASRGAFPGPARSSLRLRARAVLALMSLALLLVGVLPHLSAQAQSPRASGPSTARVNPPNATLLPDEKLWNGIPSFDLGVNDGVNWDPQYNMDVAPDGPVIQRALKAAGVPIARTWFFQTSLVDGSVVTDTEQLQKLRAVQAAGMVCFANFPTENTVAYDLHLMALLDGDGTVNCPYIEVMNEPDIETAPWNNNQQIDPTAYLGFWNSFVTQARAQYHGVYFGGPAEYDNQGDYCSYYTDGTSACFLQKVMQGMVKSGVLPDFITYHWYPCWNNTASECLALADGFASAARQVITWAKQIFGKPMPVICSEWNADPGSPSFMFDRYWDAQFIVAATRSIETSGLAGAMEFDVSSYGNYSADDLFDIYNGGAPFASFTSYAAAIAAARLGEPPPVPTPPTLTQPPPTLPAPPATRGSLASAQAPVALSGF